MKNFKITMLGMLAVVGIFLAYPSISFGDESIYMQTIISRAERGEAYYQGVLGATYRRGETGEIDYTKAYRWLKLSADNNDPIGLYNLAAMYEAGIIVPKDSTMTNELYAKAYGPMYDLAELGDPRAQVNLGYLLETGAGVQANLAEALRWYEKAADWGEPRAQFIVGYKYYHGWGYEKDYGQAAEWFAKAAEQGYPEAQNYLGNMYANGLGVIKSYDEAVNFHRQAEEFQNNIEEVTDDSALYILNGIAYEGDRIIPGLLPPNFRYEIDEGSCSEACLWSIINSKRFVTSQIEINSAGGSPGRGLHSNELYKLLDYYSIEYTDNMQRSYFSYVLAFLNPINIFSSKAESYHDFLYDEIIEKVKKGNPVILGLKIYPDEHFFWDSDHFILLVGYNEDTDELIYNDFDKRKRIKANKLLDKTEGYSIINRYNFQNYIEIKNY